MAVTIPVDILTYARLFEEADQSHIMTADLVFKYGGKLLNGWKIEFESEQDAVKFLLRWQ